MRLRGSLRYMQLIYWGFDGEVGDKKRARYACGGECLMNFWDNNFRNGYL